MHEKIEFFIVLSLELDNKTKCQHKSIITHLLHLFNNRTNLFNQQYNSNYHYDNDYRIITAHTTKSNSQSCASCLPAECGHYTT